MRISLLFIPLFSLTLTLNASESHASDLSDQGSAKDIKKFLTAKLIDLNKKQRDLMHEVAELPMTKKHVRSQETLTALEIAGAGISLSLAAESYAPVIENGLKSFCPAAPIDRASAVFNDNPWLFSAVAAALSIGGGLYYKWNKSRKPVALDSGARKIIAGFVEAERTGIALQKACYGSASDEVTTIEALEQILQENLENSAKELQELSNQIMPASSSVNSQGAKVSELLNDTEHQKTRLAESLKQKENKKQKKAKKGPQYQLSRIAKTFTNAIGLNALRAHGQTRSRLVEHVTPDILNFAAGVSSTLGMMACEQAKAQNQSQYHQELITYLKDKENQARKQAAQEIAELGTERIVHAQQFSKEFTQKTLELKNPIKAALQKLREKRENNELTPEELIANHEHLLEMVKIMLNEYITRTTTESSENDEEEYTE